MISLRYLMIIEYVNNAGYCKTKFTIISILHCSHVYCNNVMVFIITIMWKYVLIIFCQRKDITKKKIITWNN